MDGISKGNGQYPVWKKATSRPVDRKTLTEESKNKSAQRAELHVLFTAVIEELNNGENPCLSFYQLMASSQHGQVNGNG